MLNAPPKEGDITARYVSFLDDGASLLVVCTIVANEVGQLNYESEEA